MAKTVSVVRSATTFFLPARDVLAVWPAVSTEETRYYLQGAYIETHETEGVSVVSTNGHVLLKSFVTAGGAHIGAEVTMQADTYTRGFILSMDVGDKAFKAKTRGTPWIYGDTASGIIQVLDVTGEGDDAEYERVGVLEFERIYGHFPDWRRVMPTCTPGEAGTSVDVNLDNLELFRKAWRAYNGGAMRGTPVRITAGAVGAPMLVEFSDSPLRGVVMPMRF